MIRKRRMMIQKRTTERFVSLLSEINCADFSSARTIACGLPTRSLRSISLAPPVQQTETSCLHSPTKTRRSRNLSFRAHPRRRRPRCATSRTTTYRPSTTSCAVWNLSDSHFTTLVDLHASSSARYRYRCTPSRPGSACSGWKSQTNGESTNSMHLSYRSKAEPCSCRKLDQ